MEKVVTIGDATLYTGDCLKVLGLLPAGLVRSCVTSPPYFGLRDYGVDGQVGLEDTPESYVSTMVSIFREVRRVLAEDGTLWLNLGDSYNAAGRTGQGTNRASNTGADNCRPSVPSLKEKDLIGIPWRVAFALQADGWYLRQDIIWSKPNPMPESVKDRCTKAHEYIFLLSKSARYFYDRDAIRTPIQESTKARNQYAWSGEMGRHVPTESRDKRSESSHAVFCNPKGANRRSVWTVTPKPYKGAHFATFPPKLIEPCILAGSTVGDTILDPFNGSGTTGIVALKHDRKYIGVELNPEYVALSTPRLEAEQQQMKLAF